MDAAQELDRRRRVVSFADLIARRDDIDAHIAAVREAGERRDFLDVAGALTVAAKLHQLLDSAARFSSGDRSTLWAAIDYFVETDDLESDTSSPMGFDDDLEVVTEAVRRFDSCSE